jgi:hypothetical protein
MNHRGHRGTQREEESEPSATFEDSVTLFSALCVSLCALWFNFFSSGSSKKNEPQRTQRNTERRRE